MLVDQAALYRTFLISDGKGTGSAFAVDVDGKQYLMTARHVVPNVSDGDQVFVFFNNQFNALPIRVVTCEPGGADIIVMALPDLIAKGDQPAPDPGGIILSQQVYFLGFPYGMTPDTKLPDNHFSPVPFVKSGFLSAIESPGDGVPKFYIDAQVNPGFSGGPVIFNDIKKDVLKILGVVQGKVDENTPVFAGENTTGLTVKGESGLMVGFLLTPALEAIRENPIGMPV